MCLVECVIRVLCFQPGSAPACFPALERAVTTSTAISHTSQSCFSVARDRKSAVSQSRGLGYPSVASLQDHEATTTHFRPCFDRHPIPLRIHFHREQSPPERRRRRWLQPGGLRPCIPGSSLRSLLPMTSAHICPTQKATRQCCRNGR